MTDRSPEGSHFNPIVLPIGATADPDTCGSCKFFRRRDEYGSDRGVCTIVLPGWVQIKPPVNRNDEDWIDPALMKDTMRCDLQRPTGNFYQVSQRVGPQGVVPR